MYIKSEHLWRQSWATFGQNQILISSWFRLWHRMMWLIKSRIFVTCAAISKWSETANCLCIRNGRLLENIGALTPHRYPILHNIRNNTLIIMGAFYHYYYFIKGPQSGETNVSNRINTVQKNRQFWLDLGCITRTKTIWTSLWKKKKQVHNCSLIDCNSLEPMQKSGRKTE